MSDLDIRYLTADVFTDHVFGGNPLAVFPDASHIPPALMPAIAREFNYSETTFVLPPADPKHAARVRIFTPGGELPFAGHPTVGTAHVLATLGAVRLTGDETHMVLEEGVGPVPVTIRATSGVPTFAQLSVAQLPQVTQAPAPAARLAEMLSLTEADLAGPAMQPEAVSCGTPFLFVPLRDMAAVARARLRVDLSEELLRGYVTQMVFVFCMGGERADSQVRARMFAPAIGVPEDPATGSAAVGLGGYLAARDPRADGTLQWRVEQGFEMGRPSLLDVEVEKRGGATTAVRVGGRTVIVCEGSMRLPATD
jgi:trans-2,3-dihydro-3-hydroxyanthranilate isomerase